MNKSPLTPFRIPKETVAILRRFIPAKEPVLRRDHIIPVYRPDLTGNEEKYLKECIRSSWISSAGHLVKKFENNFAKKVSETTFALASNSGSTALHLACTALGLHPGDEVIAPTFTMIASINAITQTGATCVLVDSDVKSWCIDVGQIEQKITGKTKAILAVHIYGAPANMGTILRLAKRYHLWVVEDAAEAIRSEWKGKRVGGIGDIGAFSLYANKTITTGEGGMVTTNNKQLAKIVETLRNSAFSRDRHFWHEYIGFGYRMTSLQAAIGLAQLERLDVFLARKRLIAKTYSQQLSHVSSITLPKELPSSTHSFWVYGILVNSKRGKSQRDALRKHLADHGIETRTFFVPVHLQPPYFLHFKDHQFPVAERLCREGLYLPSYPSLSLKDITFITKTIESFFSVNRTL